MSVLPRLWLLGLLAYSLVGAEYYNTRTADQDFLLKQKKVYNLLYYIKQPDAVNVPLYEEGQTWDIEANINLFTNTDAVNEFLYLFKNGTLPRGALFSVYYPQLLNEMQALFKLFYYASDFNVFFKTALWAKNNINEGQYFFALYNAVLRRPDTTYIQLPPPYEIYPNFFFNSEVLQKAYYAQVVDQPGTQTFGANKGYTISANYSSWYFDREYNLENKLNYFVEDIGLNTFYFFFRQTNPFWMNSTEFGLYESMDYRGEEYLYGHKQLMNRYYLERFSNDLPNVEDLDWQKPFYPGYYPTMTLPNGLPFPQRQSWSNFPVYKYKYIQDILTREIRILSAIDSGSIIRDNNQLYNIYDEKGLNILGNIIEGNADSYNKNFYGSIDNLGRKILGYNLEPISKYQILPSALEMFTTSMRDPAFYRLYKRICDYYYRYKMQQKPYDKNEIVYPSLKIESFTVDKMITYFEPFEATISNGLPIKKQIESEKIPLIKIKQYRLNHKPFNFHFTLSSPKPMKVAIKIYLGPKYDWNHKLMELPENLKYFYEIDNWIVTLNSGLNKIVRNSKDCFFTIGEQEPSEIFYQYIEKSLNEGKPFTYNERVYGFPERLLLPKGKKEGMPFQLFLYASPVVSEYKYSSRIWGEYKYDNRPLGFPLDKPLDDFKYNGPNMMFKDILIYHKDDYDVTF